MKRLQLILQVGFTYVGTVVGAGFASGQEILQFFTQFGWMAIFTILFSCLLFIWLGIRLMITAQEIDAHSYEDLNRHLFGPVLGRWISLFTLVCLLGISTVMLAGAGSVFEENLHLSYHFGLIFTLFLTYIIIIKGMDGILMINSLVVPVMLLFTAIVVLTTLDSPAADRWMHLSTDSPLWKIWLAPFLYVAFNLALAQAVLVPLGTAIRDRTVLYWGGMMGGVIIGLMLLAGHFALSSRMPGIVQFEIPMGAIIHHLGANVKLIFAIVIYLEIFTTFLADIYGLTTQIRQRVPLRTSTIIVGLLLFCYMVSQFGFSTLLSTLYPLFGLVSLLWFVLIIFKQNPGSVQKP